MASRSHPTGQYVLPPLGPAAPAAPIPITGGATGATSRFAVPVVEVPDAVQGRLRDLGAVVSTEADTRAQASRDWWPLAMTWAVDGQVPALAAAVVRPSHPDQVGPILAVCNEARVPVTAAAGRSGVCGASVPLYGGVVLDLCDLAGIRDVDDASLVLDVLPGTFGDHLEQELRDRHALTVGHWPQSIALSTVGGWIACRGVGQLSNRYGKIEDMVIGLDVAMADGTVITTGGNARQATGPDLNQLFVGSEGTLGIITGARLRVHPRPVAEQRAAYGFTTMAAAIDACRRVLRRGATPAVLRVYDAVEAQRSYGMVDTAVVLVLDEGDPPLVAATMQVVAEECRSGQELPAELVERWLEHRNEFALLEALISKGYVVDTMEITGAWASLPDIYHETVAAISGVDGVLAASAHLSHSYSDGACLYFTFAGKPDHDDKDRFYRDVWDAGTRAVLARGGALSHHHGVGLNRARFMREALGPALDTLVSIKQSLDPNGILNPGKLGLPNPFGPNPFDGEDWA
ncbi:MAG: FAD-binding oxidoreductase [Acidimicrobiales bacterium]|jgi:alkyldihydroxyacetonephosphate synthase|nr:FAD-binding oxidoreductase [Acidimicrobiales bacterium]